MIKKYAQTMVQRRLSSRWNGQSACRPRPGGGQQAEAAQLHVRARTGGMDMLEALKKNKIIDIIYRFFLWFLIGLGLYKISFYMDDLAGEKLREAIKVTASSHFAQIIGVIGIFIGSAALCAKELLLKDMDENIPIYLLSKVSTDLILAPFNIMSLGLGWGFYLWMDGESRDEELSILGVLLLPYALIMAFLATISLVVRAERGEYIYSIVFAKPEKMFQRLFIYLSFIGATLYALFFR